MSIKLEDIESVAHLARLHLEPEEKNEAATSIANILALIDQMQSVATDTIAPLAHPFDSVQRLREDEITEENQRDKLQKIAPSTEAGLYLVPKVLE